MNLNLGAVSYCDAEGLQALLELRDRVMAAAARPRVLRLSPSVERALRATDKASLFGVGNPAKYGQIGRRA